MTLFAPPQNDSGKPERYRARQEQTECGAGDRGPHKALLTQSILVPVPAEEPGKQADQHTHDGATQEASGRGRREGAYEGCPQGCPEGVLVKGSRTTSEVGACHRELVVCSRLTARAGLGSPRGHGILHRHNAGRVDAVTGELQLRPACRLRKELEPLAEQNGHDRDLDRIHQSLVEETAE
jgi:hypothetical protein